MTIFVWNINLFIFWRLAWLERGKSIQELGKHWKHCGRLCFTTQSAPYKYIVEPKIKKVKNLFAKKQK